MESLITRESWLLTLAQRAEKELFNSVGYPIKSAYRVSCGLPSKGAFSKKLRTVGEAWHSKCSEDSTCEIFISPTIADSQSVAATLIHELVHVCVGNEAGHGKLFKQCALKIGLEGKMTATVSGEALELWVAEIIAEIGVFPHAVLDKSTRKKQTTRMLKVSCLNASCGHVADTGKPYVVRMSKSTYEIAEPICGCCQMDMQVV